ncbi:MAG: sphingomyelin synthase family protein [Ignavibacteria bacterium]|nr:sphingomyelin synthase family protein [Ignavibacteria bacterium]
MSADQHIGWKTAIARPAFRLQGVLTLILLSATLTLLRILLDGIEARDGVVLNDPFLTLFEPIDLTWLIFGMIYGGVALILIILSRYPALLVQAVQMYIVMVLMRIVCLFVVPLDPPSTMIPLRDPVVEFFGSGNIVLTRDLFFSGHTATLFLFALVAPALRWRVLLLSMSAAVAVAVLLQHVHYTVDVVVAPLASFAAYRTIRSMVVLRVKATP